MDWPETVFAARHSTGETGAWMGCFAGRRMCDTVPMVTYDTAAPKQPKVALSLADASAEVHRAATDLHHLNLGPGEALEGEWIAAGLELPDLEAMRRYRIDRVRSQMASMGYDGALLMDPMNIRYATDSTNMQIWVMHNAARYCWVGMDDSCIVWEFNECQFLDAHNPAVTGATRLAISGSLKPESRSATVPR